LVELRAAWSEGIATGRGADPESLGIEAGPYVAAEALARGLVDHEGYAQQAQAAALAAVGVDNRVVYFGAETEEPAGIGELIRLLSGTRAHAEPYVAVVAATGAISMAGGSPLGGGGGISAQALTRQLRRLAEDEMAAAVVLRIDSPGGSALGSDLLWKELMDLRARKPVVASIGSMAASGGCYLSAAATKTVAERTSIVGSIGVVAGKFSFGRSLAELGVHVETVEASEGTGARAVYGSALTPWDEPTRERVEAAVEATYDLFLRRVAEGRGQPVDVISAAAEGRIFGGQGGKDRALVDELGGLGDAIAQALTLGGLPADTPVELIAEPAGLAQLLGGGEEAARAPEQLEQRAMAVALRSAFGGLEPYRGELGTFLGTMSPLLHGERLLTAPPFMLVVR
jgi:protease-4